VTDDPGAASSGLATMVEDLVEQNLRRDPARRRLLRPGVAVLEVPDAGVAVTVVILPEGVQVRDGRDPRAIVRILADGDRLLALVAAPLRLGLPDPFARDGRRVLIDLFAGRVRVRGLLTALPTLRRLSMLLSVR
jgi:hypothetical protein